MNEAMRQHRQLNTILSGKKQTPDKHQNISNIAKAAQKSIYSGLFLSQINVKK